MKQHLLNAASALPLQDEIAHDRSISQIIAQQLACCAGCNKNNGDLPACTIIHLPEGYTELSPGPNPDYFAETIYVEVSSPVAPPRHFKLDLNNPKGLQPLDSGASAINLFHIGFFICPMAYPCCFLHLWCSCKFCSFSEDAWGTGRDSAPQHLANIGSMSASASPVLLRSKAWDSRATTVQAGACDRSLI